MMTRRLLITSAHSLGTPQVHTQSPHHNLTPGEVSERLLVVPGLALQRHLHVVSRFGIGVAERRCGLLGAGGAGGGRQRGVAVPVSTHDVPPQLDFRGYL